MCDMNNSEFLKLKKELLKIQKDRVIIAIDGRCGAGKTTLSEILADDLKASVICTDHFFLPFSMRTEDRHREPGGNIHYERFKEAVVNNLRTESDFSYRIFDCKSGEYNQIKNVRDTKFIIVEGSYSLHPKFSKYYDYAIFCKISKKEQQSRLTKREGEEGFKPFKECWIPLEEKYFGKFKISSKADFIIKV